MSERKRKCARALSRSKIFCFVFVFASFGREKPFWALLHRSVLIADFCFFLGVHCSNVRNVCQCMQSRFIELPSLFHAYDSSSRGRNMFWALIGILLSCFVFRNVQKLPLSVSVCGIMQKKKSFRRKPSTVAAFQTHYKPLWATSH